MVLVDLSAAAAARMESQVERDLELFREDQLFSRIVEQASKQKSSDREEVTAAGTFVPPCPIPIRKRVVVFCRKAYPAVGWAAVALLVISLGFSHNRLNREIELAVASKSALPALQAELNGWKVRALSSEQEREEIKRNLDESQTHARAASASLTQATDEYLQTLASKNLLEAKVAQQDEKLRAEAATLDSRQTNLDDERSDAATLRAQLQEVNARLDQQHSEVAHLQEVAASVPMRFPAQSQDTLVADARDIFGARDLHIVDVYDIDHASNTFRTYGRVYYVNHDLLLFYAFDLDQNAKSRKPVAFQAWGFRQADSKTAQSLGLFYLDDAKIDRWTLRVTDPRILARIDTLFVTAEPPGGSTSPKGHRLLFASLSGPPNHP
jgi:hypothetical protein